MGFPAARARGDASSDLATVQQRIVDQMKIDPTDETLKQIPQLLTVQKPDGSFSDLDYANTLVNDSWQPQMHLTRLRKMAAAYISDGNPYSHADTIKKAVMSGVAFWLANDFKSKNWFWNEIGVPEQLADVSLIFWDQYTDAQKTKALEILSRAKAVGASTNLVWLAQVVARRGLLQNDPAVVKGAFEKIENQIHAETKQADGPQADNSFLFHGPLLYSFGYGIAYLRDNANNATLVAGTEFTFSPDRMRQIRDWTLDGAQWFSRGIGADMGANGRGITRKGYDAKILAGIGENLEKLGIGREDDDAAMVARANGDPKAPPLVGNRQFWRADTMAHHRPAYYASARMYSNRTKNTEWGNGEAMQNFYVADGCNLLMKDGKEYFDIYPIWDWQRIPGTTVELIPNYGPVPGRESDAAPDAFVPNRNGIVHKTTEKFVGGVSDGMYGVFGGRFSRNALHINKAWFFFDDEYVCLGSGLSCDSDNPVVTTLNQCFLRGEVTVSDADGVHALPPGDHDEPAMNWALQDKVGYLFSQPVHAHVDNQTQTGSWGAISNAYSMDPVTGDVFKAWIDHGTHPADASYAYVVMPSTDADSLQAAVKSPPATVVSNTADIQAVWNAKLGRGGAIFYSAGSVELRSGLKITVDQPVMVLLGEKDSGTTVSMANPENKPLEVKLHLDRDGKSGDADFSLPGGDHAGSTVTQLVSF
jgi:chondroitin AC lyase